MKRLRWCLSLVVLVAAWLAGPSASFAQAPQIPPPATYNPVDANGVNVSSGAFTPTSTAISVGPSGQGGLSYTATYDTEVQAWRHSTAGVITRAPVLPPPPGTFRLYTVVVMGQSFTFRQLANGTFMAREGGTSTLTLSGQTYTLRMADGTVALFSKTLSTLTPYLANEGQITSITRPNGEVITFTYTSIQVGGFWWRRLQSVNNNYGYQIHFEYGSNSANADWYRLVEVAALNNAVEYCDPAANACAANLHQRWSTLRFDTTNAADQTITDSLGQVTHFLDNAGGYVTGIRRPTLGSGQNVTLTWDGSVDPQRVLSVSDGVGTWSYAYAQGAPVSGCAPPACIDTVTTITDPLSHTSSVVTRSIDPLDGTGARVVRVRSVTNQLGQATLYEYNSWRLSRVTYPEGNKVEYDYDGRGNVIQTRQIAKPGSGLSNIVTSAAYPASCGPNNYFTCNQPDTVTDARSDIWSFTYDTTHGGVLTTTSPSVYVPAPTNANLTPQTRYEYEQNNARVLNASSQVVALAPVWALRRTRQCALTAPNACANQDSEVVNETMYQPDGVSDPVSNVLAIATTARAGDNTPSATVATTYTSQGDPLTVDGPRTDVADIVNYRYDAMRQRLGEISAAVTVQTPSGPQTLRPSVRTSYNADGQVTNVERGTLPQTLNTPPTAWDNGFATLENSATLYDVQGRKIRDTYAIGAVAQRVTQYTYDAASRLDCSVVRMNPAVFGSLPSSACTLSTQGANGSDRITRNTYDWLGRVTVVTSAYGTALAQATRTNAYTTNGQIDWVEDANANRSDYAYDGFDRLSRLTFPSPTTTHTPNASDYEEYGYDANGNMTARRVRSGETIGYTYDALNRQIQKDIPGGTSEDVNYGYDLLGRQLHARFVNGSGQGIVYEYDALSRVLTETETWNSRTLTYDYDPAGNRTRVMYPAGAGITPLYVDYTYDILNRMSVVSENGGAALSTYAYDFLSRRAGIARASGPSTTYTYTSNSQNWSMAQDLSGSSDDLTLAFTLSPAPQILTRNLSNPNYNWAPTPLNQSYSRNGLNQYTAVGGASQSHDLRGNLTSDGARSFSYDLENRLLSVSGSASGTLAYDPLGRLRTYARGATTTFLYDGDRLVAEYNGATLLRRYVHGAGVDEPIAQYEGADLTDRRYLIADNQGTIVAEQGAATTRYTYGPYGEPNTWSGQRFRYTGQIALPEVGLYHYKARAYDPVQGRFLQTDPVGYRGGMHLYRYVFNNPLNLTDPWGQQASAPCTPVPVPIAKVDAPAPCTAPAPTTPAQRPVTSPPPSSSPGPAPQPGGPLPSPPQPDPLHPLPRLITPLTVFWFVFDPRFSQAGAYDDCQGVIYCSRNPAPTTSLNQPHSEDECDNQWVAERGQCFSRYPSGADNGDGVINSWRRGCLERARDRHVACRGGYPPPPEWADVDER